MGCGKRASAIFDGMFGALAEGSQRTDGVLIPSVAFLPPTLHHSTYHSAPTCSHVVVLSSWWKKTLSDAFIAFKEALNDARTPRNWLKEKHGSVSWYHVMQVYIHPDICDIRCVYITAVQNPQTSVAECQIEFI